MTCHYCGRMDFRPTKDHMIPLSKGGENLDENIVICCKRCNMLKGSREYGFFTEKFAQFLRENPEYIETDSHDFDLIKQWQSKFDKWLQKHERTP